MCISLNVFHVYNPCAKGVGEGPWLFPFLISRDCAKSLCIAPHSLLNNHVVRFGQHDFSRYNTSKSIKWVWALGYFLLPSAIAIKKNRRNLGQLTYFS